MKNRAASKRLLSVVLPACCIPLAAAQIQGLASGFDVQITLSQKAAAKLSSQSQGMVLVASYSANVAPNATSGAATQTQSQPGKLDLGHQTMDIPGRAETVRMNGPNIPDRIIESIRGPVLLSLTAHSGSIHSSAASTSNNLLSCNSFDGTFQDAVRKGPVLHCSLTTENDVSTNSTPQSIPPDRVADSYAIYALLVPGSPHNTIAQTPTQNWRLADTTINISDMNPAVPPNGQLNPPPENPRGFDEAVHDYNTRKYERFHLDAASFHPAPPFPLIDSHQASNIRQSGSPNTGITFFSAVYFDSHLNAALVYVNLWCANLCSAGQWVYLEKHNGQWVRRSGLTTGGA